MIERSLRHLLRRCGLEIPFRQVICTDQVKTVSIGPDMRAKVTVRRMLVFLDVPERGDLQDVIPVEPGTPAAGGAEPDAASYTSPDAVEIGRERRGDVAVVRWRPRTAITPYSIYMHEYVWQPSGAPGGPAMHTEVRCDMRTGRLVLEMLTPKTFSTAVVFKRPRWRRLKSERSLIKYALRRLDDRRAWPALTDAGTRLEWKVLGPKLGDRYVCVAFHAGGVAQWQERMKAATLIGRLRHLLRRPIPA